MRLLVGSLSLQPAGLHGSLNEPLSGNIELRVTPDSSLKLRGKSFLLPPIGNSGLMLCGITLESSQEKTPDCTVHIGKKIFL